MANQTGADDAAAEQTQTISYSSGKSPHPSRFDSDNRQRLILGGIIAVLAIVIVILLTTRSPARPVTVTPTPDELISRPVELSIKGAAFKIVPITVNNNRWQATNAGARSAEWVYGTVVNFVVGLYPTDETTKLIDGLAEGDPISLSMSNGAELSFKMSGRQRVPADSVGDLVQQSRPGITLVVLGEGGAERLVVIGQYDADREPLTVGAGLTSVGAPVQLGDWRITVLSGQLAPDSTDPAQAFYYVTFNVEYLGSEPIGADAIDVKLIDGVRVEYIIDRAVSNNGPYGPPAGLIAPHNPTSFTAGYRVPTNVPGPSLVWVFKPSADADSSARFEVPIVKPTPTPVPNTQITVVNCCTATLSEDQTRIILKGGIGNPTDQQVTINPIDVSLNTPDNVFSDLVSAQPPFPWLLPAEQTLAFELQFTRPPGLSAILRIVTLQFELSASP